MRETNGESDSWMNSRDGCYHAILCVGEEIVLKDAISSERMDRRQVLAVCCSSALMPVVGCLDRDTSTASDDPRETDTNTVGALESDQMRAVYALLVTEAPSEVDITPSTREAIADDPVLDEILSRSVESGRDLPTEKRASGEYEVVTIDTDEMDREKLYDAAVSLEKLPAYDEDSTEHPLGRYVEHEGQLLVFGYGVDD